MKDTTNFDSEYVCFCKNVTLCDLKAAFLANRKLTYSDLQRDLEVGLQCASCEYEVKGALDDYRAEVGIASEVDDRPLLLQKGAKAKIKALVSSLLGKDTRPMKAGLFAIRKPGFETAVILSNLDFPELERNPNGSKVTFRATYVDQAGEVQAVSPLMTLQARTSHEYSLDELFPKLKGDLVGSIYVEYRKLHMTGSLRPFAVLNAKGDRPEALTRSHYHDKYATFDDPGHFQTAFAAYPGQTTWVAIVNCQDRDYDAKVTLKTPHERHETTLHLDPMATVWRPLLSFFPDVDPKASNLDPALFFLDNPQHVMMWFFWQSDVHHTWVANHH